MILKLILPNEQKEIRIKNTTTTKIGNTEKIQKYTEIRKIDNKSEFKEEYNEIWRNEN